MSDMKASAVIILAQLSVFAAAPLSHARADASPPDAYGSCDVTIHVTEEAEKRLGGASYEGPLESADVVPEPKAAMPGMAGAHEVHIGQHGGVFFMAPNKINHLEAKYSEDCGMLLFIYNAFTEPISVGRFQASYRIIPEDDREWDKEVVRFLSPIAEGTVLQASGEHDIKGPYKIELYVKFPESDDAEMFNIPVGQTVH
ncbi:hypothetical protein [Mesorhizobium sp. L-8-3]|uniref:hypothetical protein n=1 Tax=Mesorhizobium sp. L-8-3 TaxID=2744522 RepID=UPI001926A108|nr:hypothetical protein [Mesorhizobium sp. L-8-3]BCH25054.1 hypothetical protein MesoLjLb_48390 [Mesorhizobium sp. L-8-3]